MARQEPVGAAAAPRPVARVAPAAPGVPARQFVRFLVVGVVNTAVGYGLFAVFILLGLHYGIATALATVLGVLWNFQTIGRVVFASRDRSRLVRFAAVYALGYVLNVGILWALQPTRIHVLVIQAVLVLPMAALAFTLHRRFVFRKELESP